MKINIFQIIQSFPEEIIHHILSYDGRVKMRNGKYMYQINKDDARYKLLQTIPMIEKVESEFFQYHYMVRLNNNNIEHDLHLINNGEKIKCFHITSLNFFYYVYY